MPGKISPGRLPAPSAGLPETLEYRSLGKPAEIAEVRHKKKRPLPTVSLCWQGAFT